MKKDCSNTKQALQLLEKEECKFFCCKTFTRKIHKAHEMIICIIARCGLAVEDHKNDGLLIRDNTVSYCNKLVPLKNNC
jgi:hypothetical protein